jgi:DNA-binding NarL/FixJ family response regulator
MSAVRLLLADDHTLVRAGLRKLLEMQAQCEVVGEAADGIALLELAATLQPDVVLLDIAMPGLNGLQATERLLQTRPDLKIMVLSMHQNEEYVRQALRLGAVAYLLKDAAPLELELALQAVLRGETYLSPAVSSAVVSDYAQRLRDEHAHSQPLTPRQLDVLRGIALGQSTKEIARDLGLSVKTIDTHRTQLMRELDIHEVAGLVRYALKIGIITV